MTLPIEQSIKEKIRSIAKSRDTSFAELWRNLILERFLARLCQSQYKHNFIFKGGALLARYLTLGRETKDIDFLVNQLSNEMEVLGSVLEEISAIDLNDSFEFKTVNVDTLNHDHMPYTGATVKLIAKFGATKTHLDMDLGFGDVVEPIDYSVDLISTKKGPLFESRISLSCYPKEFIFAEKLETVVFRGGTNSRMKDFHDLYSLISIPNLLNEIQAERAVRMVFEHRGSGINELPIVFDDEDVQLLNKTWGFYYRRLKSNEIKKTLPTDHWKLTQAINDWLLNKTKICHKES